jgi:hypothetical protein
MKIATSFSFALLIALSATFAYAQETETEAKSCQQCPTTSAVAASQETQCSSCPVTAAMAKLPKMTYKVGDEGICCSESAAALAKKHDKPIHFVVGEKTFEDKTEAYTALVETTEKFVNEFVTPKKCEKSGTTSVAGKSCGCPMQAGKNAEIVKKAVGEVKMTFVVGKEKCQCPTQAKALAKDSDAKTTYVVAGKETCCNLEARLNFAKAKYAAAVKALASTEKAETKTESKDS